MVLRESERKCERAKLRSSIHGVLSVGIDGVKNESSYSTRATRGYRKHGISPRIQARSPGNQKFRVYEVSTRLPKVSFTLQEIGILPTLVYFTL